MTPPPNLGPKSHIVSLYKPTNWYDVNIHPTCLKIGIVQSDIVCNQDLISHCKMVIMTVLHN